MGGTERRMIWRSSPLEELPLEATPPDATLPQPSPCAGRGPDLEEVGGAGGGLGSDGCSDSGRGPRVGENCARGRKKSPNFVVGASPPRPLGEGWGEGSTWGDTELPSPQPSPRGRGSLS